MKPYVVFYSYDTHGFDSMLNVFSLFDKDKDYDVTILLAANKGHGPWQDPHVINEVRFGLQEKKFKLGRLSFARKPDVVIGFRLWWMPDLAPCHHACSLSIPVIMLNHGAMFIHNDGQKYKRNLAGAKVNCIWGKHDLRRWLRWINDKSKFVITGNPLHDVLPKFECPELSVPDEYALLLTPRGQRKFLNPSAEALNKIIPVVAKCHPIDKQKDYYKNKYQTFTEPETLLPLIYKAKLIISNVTSALMPALFWSKPVFIHSFQTKGYHFDDFRKEFKKVFNFKQDSIWSNDIIDTAVKPTINDYEYFAHKPDGKNALRVAEVIKRFIK